MKCASDFPLYDVTPFSSVREMLAIAEREAGAKTAFRYWESGDLHEISYAQLVRDVYALGAALHELGLSAAHVAQIGENSYPWVTVYLAMLAGDGVFVPVDRDLPPPDILHILDHSDATAVVYTPHYAKTLLTARASLSRVRYWICVDPPEKGASCEVGDPQILSWSQLLAHGYALLESGYSGFASLTPDMRAMRMLVYTSGTTGLAKGVMLSEANIVAGVYHGLRVSSVYDTCLSVLPYHHTYEAVCGLLAALHHHATICIGAPNKTVMKNLAIFHPECVYLVPSVVEDLYRRIWAAARSAGKEKALAQMIRTSDALRRAGIDMRRSMFPSIHQALGGNLLKIVCGGAPLRAELGEFFSSVGICLVNGYGITECSPLVAVNRDDFNDPATVGVPLPCCEVRCVDADDNGEGEILVRGDIVMLGYYKDPARTAQVLSVDGWFSTGDYGRMNDRGQLIITGRKKNIIVLSNGKNIYPEELEQYIQRIPYVADVVVYASRDEWGEETGLTAEVYLDDEKLRECSIGDPAAALRRDVRAATAALPLYKQIGKIALRREPFVKTTTSKIRRADSCPGIIDSPA